MVIVLFYIIFGLIAFIDVYFFIKITEYLYCAIILKQPPFVPSSRYLRYALVKEIHKRYSNCRVACDIGSGYGGLARFVARQCGCRVVALENMPFSAVVSWLNNAFCPSVRTVYRDAFKYLANTDEIFDVGIAYLGPDYVSQLLRYKKRFRVLITLDFEIPEMRPVRIIDVGHGMTRYNGVLYPHRLFVYEFDK